MTTRTDTDELKWDPKVRDQARSHTAIWIYKYQVNLDGGEHLTGTQRSKTIFYNLNKTKLSKTNSTLKTVFP